MCTWQFASLLHVFFAYRTFFVLIIPVFDNWIARVDVSQLHPKLPKFLDLPCQLEHEFIHVLDHEYLSHGEVRERKHASTVHDDRAEHDTYHLLTDVKEVVGVKFLNHSLVIVHSGNCHVMQVYSLSQLELKVK